MSPIDLDRIAKVKKLAYFIWRSLPSQFDLDDITSEAVLAALQCKPGVEVIAAKRAIYDYLRRCQPGSRGTGKQCLLTVWWLPTEGATQERDAIAADERERLMRAVDQLTALELEIIQAKFWRCQKQGQIARDTGHTEAHISRILGRALEFLRGAIYVTD